MVLRRYLSFALYGGATNPLQAQTTSDEGTSSGDQQSDESPATAAASSCSALGAQTAGADEDGTRAEGKSARRQRGKEVTATDRTHTAKTFAERHSVVFLLAVFLIMLTTALQVYGWANLAASLKGSGKLRFLCHDGGESPAPRLLAPEAVASTVAAPHATRNETAVGVVAKNTSGSGGGRNETNSTPLAGAEKTCTDITESTLSTMFLTSFLCFVLGLLVTGRVLDVVGSRLTLLFQIGCFATMFLLLAGIGEETSVELPGLSRGRESVAALYTAAALLGFGSYTYLPLMKATQIAGKRSELRVAVTNAFAEMGCVFFYVLALLEGLFRGEERTAAGASHESSAFAPVMLGMALYMLFVAAPLVFCLFPSEAAFAGAVQRLQQRETENDAKLEEEAAEEPSGDPPACAAVSVVIRMPQPALSFPTNPEKTKGAKPKDVFSIDFPAFNLASLQEVLQSKRGKYLMLWATVQAARLIVFTGTMDLQLDFLGQENGEWTRIYGQVSLTGFFCYLVFGGLVQPWMFSSKYSRRQEVSFNLLKQKSFFPTLPNVWVGTFVLNMCGVLFQIPLTFPRGAVGLCSFFGSKEGACSVLNVQMATFIFSVFFRVLLYSLLCSYMLNFFGYRYFARNYSLVAFSMSLAGAVLSPVATQAGILRGSFDVVNYVSFGFGLLCFSFDVFLWRHRNDWRRI